MKHIRRNWLDTETYDIYDDSVPFYGNGYSVVWGFLAAIFLWFVPYWFIGRIAYPYFGVAHWVFVAVIVIIAAKDQFAEKWFNWFMASLYLNMLGFFCWAILIPLLV